MIKTERSSEWIRNLDTFPGRVGAGTQRTVPSDADAVVAVSVYGRQRLGLGGVGRTCATERGTEFRTRFRTRSKQQILARIPKRKAQRKAKQRGRDKPKEGTSDTSSMKCFLLQGERPRPKGLPQVLGVAR